MESQPTTDTSRQAAFSMLPLMVAQWGQVLVFIVERGDFGTTDFEIQDALKMTGDSERPRRYALQRRGLVTAELAARSQGHRLCRDRERSRGEVARGDES